MKNKIPYPLVGKVYQIENGDLILRLDDEKVFQGLKEANEKRQDSTRKVLKSQKHKKPLNICVLCDEWHGGHTEDCPSRKW